eukprot:6237331-Alexandrium_andersonii.AAC.1
MSASLVGSEMCIRDSPMATDCDRTYLPRAVSLGSTAEVMAKMRLEVPDSCLLYTSPSPRD